MLESHLRAYLLAQLLMSMRAGRAGTITAVLGDGALASVRWDVDPAQEHQYRVGRFSRFELVRSDVTIISSGEHYTI